MLRKSVSLFCLTLLLSCWGMGYAADSNHALEDYTFPDGDLAIGSNTYLYSKEGGTITGYPTSDITISAGTSLTIGSKKEGTGAGFDFHTGLQVKTTDASSTFNVFAPTGGDVTLNIGGLSMNTGGVAQFGSGTGTGNVVFTASTLSADGNGTTTLMFKDNATAIFTSVANGKLGSDTLAGKVNLNLDGGKVGFENAFTLANGAVNVSTDSVMAIGGGGLTVNNENNASDAVINVGSNALTILQNLNNPKALGTLTIGSDNSSGGGTLSISGGVLNTGSLVLTTGAQFGWGASGNINTGTLHIKDSFEDEYSVVTTATGLTTIDSGATYTVTGSMNTYSGGMLVEGTLLGDNVASIWLGTATNNLKTIQVNGGSIKAAGPGEFTINYADIVITQAGNDPALDASDGKLDLANSNVTIDLAVADTAIIDATKGIDINNYRQIVGDADLSVGSGQMTVTGSAVIGSGRAGQKVNLDVSGNSVTFSGGLTLDNYGSISSAQSDGNVVVGGTGITANGNNTLDAGGNTLVFAPNPASAGKMNWNGAGGSVLGNVDQSRFDVTVGSDATLTVSSSSTTEGYEVGSLTVYGKLGMGTGASAGVIESSGNVSVKNGGTLFANDGTAHINNVGPVGNVLSVDKGGTLSAANGTIYANNFKSVNINGTYVAGLPDGAALGQSSHLVASSNINVGSSGLITMTPELAAVASASKNVNDATWLLEIDNSGGSSFTITNNANMSSISMLGKYQFALNSDSTVLYLADASGKVILDGSNADRWQAIANLQDMWGREQIKDDLGSIIYGVVKGDIVADPADSPAGNKNVNLLTAIASPEGRFVGLDTLEYINGAHLFGVTDVAMETNRTFMSDMSNRTKALECSFVAARDSFGSDAFASTAMNDILYNRFWFGGSGLKQDADDRDGFSGYKYKSYGFVGGYDRVAAENTAAGFSFAYNRGDYEDKGTAEHDSEIESFSVGLYGTHSSPCGWFLSGHGGYTYSQNDIRELRRDPDLERYSWSESNFRTNTWSLGAIFGYDFRLLENSLVITPSIGMNYITAKNSDHDSTLGGIATQRVLGVKNSAVYAPVELGIQYDRELGPESKLRVEVNGGYAYNLRGSGMTGSINFFGLSPDSTFSIHGPENYRHSYKIGGGVRYSYRTLDLGLRYDYSGRSSYSAHRFIASAGFSF